MPDPSTARASILEAAHACVLERGYAGVSTRRVAERAGVPLSQIHYHFGSKQRLFVALLAELDRKLLERQRETFAADAPLSRKWEQACDYLDADLESGYVRVLQEMIAAGFADPEIGRDLREQLGAWLALLREIAEEAEALFGGLGPFSAVEAASLVGAAFLGAEEGLLLGMDEETLPVRRALRKIGAAIRRREEGGGDAG